MISITYFTTDMNQININSYMTGQIKIPETGYKGHFEITVSLNRRDEDGHFGPGMKV